MSDSETSDFKKSIYKIDNKIHELLIERTELIEANAKSNIAKLMLGKEASIIKKLLKKHKGNLPKIVIARIWREILTASASLNNETHVAVLANSGKDNLAKVTQEHFGSNVEYVNYSSSGQIMNAITTNESQLGVVPCDNHVINQHPWWTSLKVQDGNNCMSIVAKLPFLMSKNENDNEEGYVVAVSKPDESGDDITIISIEAKGEISISTILEQLEKLGFKNAKLVISCAVDGETKFFLIEVDGYITEDDKALKNAEEFFDDIHIIGAYAKPIEV